MGLPKFEIFENFLPCQRLFAAALVEFFYHFEVIETGFCKAAVVIVVQIVL